MTTRSRPNHPAAAQARAAALAKAQRRRRFQLGAWAGALVLISALVTVGLLTSRPSAGDTQRAAPDFTLPTTAGATVSLDDYRGHAVLLYFNEGAGCGACTMQLAGIEKKQQAFDDADVTVLPIVMNTREQIQPDLDQYGVTTPVLLDDGTVSQAYGTLGKGMHEGLPGHSFVLIGPDGTQLWYGEYPSMWLEPQELLDEVISHLAA